MPTFFIPLRRKIGVLTLAMACAFAAGWVRSLSINDQVVIPCEKDTNVHFMHSVDGSLRWTYFEGAPETTFLKWKAIEWEAHPWASQKVKENDASFDWQLRWLGFGVGKLKPGMMGSASASDWIVPYWSIILPLTLLSAWLLLSKPRVADERPK